MLETYPDSALSGHPPAAVPAFGTSRTCRTCGTGSRRRPRLIHVTWWEHLGWAWSRGKQSRLSHRAGRDIIAAIVDMDLNLDVGEHEKVFPLKIGVLFPDSTFGLLPDNISGLLPDKISGLLPDRISGLLPESSGLLPERISGLLPERISDLLPESSAVLFRESRSVSLPDRRSIATSSARPSSAPRFFSFSSVAAALCGPVIAAAGEEPGL